MLFSPSPFCNRAANEIGNPAAKETHHNVIHFAPPLLIDTEIIDWAHQSIHAALNTK
jgi:acetylornithine/succinyldiaminopimelate/putrescine aminotransferase